MVTFPPVVSVKNYTMRIDGCWPIASVECISKIGEVKMYVIIIYIIYKNINRLDFEKSVSYYNKL